RRPEVDPEGRRLLQRMHQEAEGRGLTLNWARPDVSAAPTIRAATFRPTSPPVARACADRVRETVGSGRTRSSRTGTPAHRLPPPAGPWRGRDARHSSAAPHRRSPPRWRRVLRTGPIA